MTENTNKWNGENPWMGLGTYSEGQRLYGRDKETATLFDVILNHTAIVVYGKSGIGKSSLLKAGVFPLLRQQHFIPIYLRLAHNTDISYIQQIENAISESLTLQNLLPDSIPNLGLWDFLHRNRFTDVEGNAITPVIVLDQFEEIFTLTQVEYKADIQAFFTELTDVLNDVKPDKVIQAELSFAQSTSEPSKKTESKGFTLQPLSKSVLNYEKSPSFRFVISLRDDSLYLLERNSAKIPALKANRYNLNALDEKNAMEVILKPCPGLFSEVEGKEILDGLAYYEYDDYRVVDPAIISLFLFSYYKEKGNVAYTDIFERYYQDCTKNISEDSITYIEDHLLTDRGNRNQIPMDDLTVSSVSDVEMNLLLQRKILKTEKRKGMEYVEFSHDRLCEQALKHREERKLHEQTRKMRKRMTIFGLILIGIMGITTLVLGLNKDNRRMKKEQKELQVAYDSINELNNSNNALINKNEHLINDIQNKNEQINLKNDSLSRLTDSLSTLLSINEQLNKKLKTQIRIKSDSLISTNDTISFLRKKLTIFSSISNTLQRILVASEKKADSLQSVISIYQKAFEDKENTYESSDDFFKSTKGKQNQILFNPNF